MKRSNIFATAIINGILAVLLASHAHFPHVEPEGKARAPIVRQLAAVGSGTNMTITPATGSIGLEGGAPTLT